MDNTEQFYRQGDIFFLPLTQERRPWRYRVVNDIDPISNQVLDEGAVKGGVIAKGETTGHMHKVDMGNLSRRDAILASLTGLGGLILRVFNPTRIVHEEHGTVTLPAGDYLVRNQREFDPLTQERAVLD